MFAIVRSGGKQYRVEEGQKITLGRLEGDVGSTITLGPVLGFGDGANLTLDGQSLGNASVQAEIIKQGRGDTIIIFKKKRRQNYRRRNGHRQHETIVQIKSIKAA